MEYINSNGTNSYGDKFISEQINFSTADIQRMEFCGKSQETTEPLIQVGNQIQKFQLIDGELFVANDSQLPPNSKPLTRESGIFSLIGISEA